MPRFSETLLEHARYPRNFGRDPEASVVGKADHQGQPPRVEIYLTIGENRITQARFYAEGCGVVIGLTSALTELVRGQRIAVCDKITTAELIAQVENVPPDKSVCVDIVLKAFRMAVRGQHEGTDNSNRRECGTVERV